MQPIVEAGPLEFITRNVPLILLSTLLLVLVMIFLSMLWRAK